MVDQTLVALAVCSVFVAAFLVGGVESLTQIYYNTPTNPEDPEMIAKLSFGQLFSIFAAWLIGSFGGCAFLTFAAAYLGVGVTDFVALVPGLCILGASVLNLINIQHPTWFWLAVVLIPLVSRIGATVGRNLNAKKQTQRKRKN